MAGVRTRQGEAHMRGAFAAAAATIAMVCALPAMAGATTVSATMTGSNGEGTFNSSLPCGSGDGPNWRYFWLDQPASSPGGRLAGLWDGTFEVHDAGGRGGRAFIPDGDGRLTFTVARGGSGFLETTGGGGCDAADLFLTDPFDDPVVSGSIPIVATGGTGALRGLTGSGLLNISALELGPGAQNAASLALSADLDVADPALAFTGASSRWQNLSAYLNKRLTVSVTLRNATGAGNAFALRVTGVTGGTGSFTGVPTGTVSALPAGNSTTFSFSMHGASPNTTYTLHVTGAAQDGLLSATPPVTGSVTFKSPQLP